MVLSANGTESLHKLKLLTQRSEWELWVLTRAVHTTSLVILTPVPSMGTAQTLQTPTLRLRGNGTCPGSRASKWQRQLESKAKLFLLLLLRQVLCPQSPRPQGHPPGKPRAVGKGTGVSAHLVTQGSPSPCTPPVWIYNWLKEQPARPTAAPSPCPAWPWVGSQAFLLLGPGGDGGTW